MRLALTKGAAVSAAKPQAGFGRIINRVWGAARAGFWPELQRGSKVELRAARVRAATQSGT